MYSVSLNGAPIGSQTNWENWAAVGTIPILPTTGLNTLQVVGTNYGSTAFPTASSNPAGLIFKGEVKYLVPSETAWGAGAPFGGKNWATYFTYTTNGCTPVGGTISVPAYGVPLNSPLVVTSVNFVDDKIYKVTASGTAHANVPIEFDAEYSWNLGDGVGTTPGNKATDPWIDGVTGYSGYGPDLLDLKVNGNFVDWGTYNPAHIYQKEFIGTGSPATFQLQIYDFAAYNDFGELTVNICEVY
jgi:hypothetical protein